MLFSVLFMAAGQVNAVFATLYPVDYMLFAIGIALIVLGYRTWTKDRTSIIQELEDN